MMRRFFRRRAVSAIESVGLESEATTAGDSIATSDEVAGSPSASAEEPAASSQTHPKSASESALTYDPNSTVPHPTSAGGQLAGGEMSTGALASVGRLYADERYRILGVLGKGGMGIVYRAEDLHLRRIVALKTILTAKTTNPKARRRFLDEARAASALEHPNICTVHEVGETAQGQLYISMTCYEGETLKNRLERGPLRLGEALKITYEVARGLAKAHDKGIVHCDIKPANLMLTAEGPVKILDFGIARLLGESDLNSGVPGGTPRYRSPEQARGERVGPESDIWSLGLVLFEMLTGRLPSRSQGGDASAFKVVATFELPPKINRILSRMLAPLPSERFSEADSVVAQLDELRKPTRGNITIRPLNASRRRRLGDRPVTAGVLVWATLAMAVIGVGVFAFDERSWPTWIVSLAGNGRKLPFASDESDSTIEEIEFDSTTGRATGAPHLLLNVSGVLSGCDPSPDGKWLVCQRLRRREELFVIRTDGSGRQPLIIDGNRNRYPVFSPRGSRIAFYSDRGGKYDIWSIGVDGKDLRQETDLPAQTIAPLWSPAGRVMAVEIGGHTALIDLSVSPAARSAQLLPPLDRVSRFAAQAWSPDGRWLAGARRLNNGAYERGIWLYSFADGRYSRLTNDGNGPTWLADSRRLLYFRGVQGFIFDLQSKRSQKSFTLPSEGYYSHVNLSPNGRRLYVARIADEGSARLLRAPQALHH